MRKYIQPEEYCVVLRVYDDWNTGEEQTSIMYRGSRVDCMNFINTHLQTCSGNLLVLLEAAEVYKAHVVVTGQKVENVCDQ